MSVIRANEDILVSILVISYNSSKYINQTLESIKNQTYQRIEIVISDDFSSDNTIEIVESWLLKNSSRFFKSSIVISKQNLGIPKNINQGIRICRGEYIKLIAADDVLDINCVEDNYVACKKNGYRLLFSNMLSFYENDIENSTLWEYKGIKKYFDDSSEKQHKTLAFMNFPYAPTSFFEKKLIDDVGYFDESYKYLEDYPMWFKITAQGIKLNYLDKPTVFYRIHQSSLSNSENDIMIFREKFYKCERDFFYQRRLKYLLSQNLLYQSYVCLINFLYSDMIILFGNKKNVFTKSLRIILLLDPSQYLHFFRKVIRTFR